MCRGLRAAPRSTPAPARLFGTPEPGDLRKPRPSPTVPVGGAIQLDENARMGGSLDILNVGDVGAMAGTPKDSVGTSGGC